jgi:hypothetical protein
MFYLQFVIMALPPILARYQVVDQWPVHALAYSLRSLFGAVTYSLSGLYGAFLLQREEAKALKLDKSAVADLGARVSVRELGTSISLDNYLRDLDVEKYYTIIERLILESVQDFLAAKGVDTSAFGANASTIINGDVIRADNISGSGFQIGSRQNKYSTRSRDRG